MSDVTLHLGDCLDVMRGLPDGCVDAVVTDPPYGTTRNAWDTPFPLPEWWDQIERVTKASAAIVVCAQAPFDKTIAVSRLSLFRYEWVWRKDAGTGHLNAKKAPLKNHEVLLVFYRNPPTYNPQMRPGKPYKITSGRGSSNYGKQVSVETVNSGERYPVTVLDFNRDRDKRHPTQKPVDLIRYMIRTYTNQGGVIFDPFMGSGTTGVACIREGRSFIGIEREPAYHAIAEARIAHARGEVRPDAEQPGLDFGATA